MKIKRIFCAVLVFVLAFILIIPAAAVSSTGSLNDLRAPFKRGQGPKDGYAIDYSYFSPVKGEKDSTKYPLCVFLPGFGEGRQKGKELTMNEACRWAGDEFQNKFYGSHGAYILLARAREELTLSWNASGLIKGLKAAVTDFVQKNPNVDTDRIYVLGWSYGAVGAINQAVNYPDLYAAGVFFAPPASISENNAKRLKNTAICLDICPSDSFAVMGYQNTSWKNLKAQSADKSKVIKISYDRALTTGGMLYNHNTWLDAFWDMHSTNSTFSKKTVTDANGNTLDFDSMISWLSKQTLVKNANIDPVDPEELEVPDTPDVPDDQDTPEEPACTCACHKTGLAKFFWNLRVIIWRLLDIHSQDKVCKCGVSHW